MPPLTCSCQTAKHRAYQAEHIIKKNTTLGLNMEETIEREDMNVRAGEVFWRVK